MENRKKTRPRVSETAPAGPPGEPHFGGNIFLRDVPKTTHRAFKIACANKVITMRDAQIILMRRFAMAVARGQKVIRIDEMRPKEADAETNIVGA